MSNPFRGLGPSHFGSCDLIVAVTPSDTVDLPPGCVAVYVAGAGNLACRQLNGGDAVLTIPVGDFTLMPGPITRVMATGTTATGIFALLVLG